MADYSFGFEGRNSFWSERAIRSFCKVSARMAFNKEESIQTPVDENNSVYLIESGTVNMRYYTKEGNAITVLKKFPGDFFGIKGLFQQKQEKHFYVVAATNVVCWKISRVDFLKLIETDYEFTVCAFRWYTTYIDIIETKMLNSAFMSTYQKLVVSLLDSCEMTGKNTGVVKETQQELGSLLSATRQTVSAYLTILEERGLIDIARGKIILKDIETLKNEIL